MIFMVRVGAAAGAANALAATEIASKAANEAKEARRRMVFLPVMVHATLQAAESTVEPRPVCTWRRHRFSRLGFFITRTHVGEAIYQKARHGFTDRPGRPAAQDRQRDCPAAGCDGGARAGSKRFGLYQGCIAGDVCGRRAR